MRVKRVWCFGGKILLRDTGYPNNQLRLLLGGLTRKEYGFAAGLLPDL